MTSDLICLQGGHCTLGENNYSITLSKCPWALATQAQKIEGGQLKEEMVEWFNYFRVSTHLASSPGHSQILSCSCGIKSGSGHEATYPGYKVSCQGLPNQLASLPVLCYLTSSVVHGESCVTFFRKALEELYESW